MIKPIVRDIFFLKMKSVPAVRNDVPLGQDLLDTLRYNRLNCVGLAGNMIGITKRIIAVSFGGRDIVMYNPEITEQTEAYETYEGCLSLDGERKTTRFKTITVEYSDEKFRKRKLKLEGFPAQIVQHEIDHLNGIII